MFSLDLLLSTLEAIRLISLNCLVLGDDPKRGFTVEIENTKSVSILRDLIKQKKSPSLNYIAASDLDLWKVDISAYNYAQLVNFKPDASLKLLPYKQLSTIFKDEHR